MLHSDPIAFFLTWSTYGTWLPGDERGWVDYQKGWQLPDSIACLEAQSLMSENACRLSAAERSLVEIQASETCLHRGWTLHAVNCRSNHVHLVVTARETQPSKIRNDLKSWCTRRLKSHNPSRTNWWAERGSQRYIFTEETLELVIRYVAEAQDRKARDNS